MLLTEQDAKTKQCCGPYIAASATMATSANIDLEVAPGTFGKCIASECMAWRWSEYWFQEEIQRRSRAAPSASVQAIADRMKAEVICRGYCGLAGRIEP